MKTCKYEGWIDGYLMGRLGEAEQREFEEHYFNCESCFREMVARDEIIGVLKTDRSVFPAETGRKIRKAAWHEKLSALLSPRQWATAGVAAALVIAAVIGMPLLRRTSPQFTLNGDNQVRGTKVALISPVQDVQTAPSVFEWTPAARDAEYKVSVFDDGLIWETSTKEDRVSLPDDVRARMLAGRSYSWEVKAFTKEGTLIADSGRVSFKIAD